MKKVLLALLMFVSFCFGLFAQEITTTGESAYDMENYETDKLKTEVIIPENQHLEDQTGSVKIEYMPMYDEVRIYYECMYVTYDRGQAMNTVLECLADFQNEHKYIGYRYLRDDREKYFKDDRNRRKAQYISYVKFIRYSYFI